MGLGGKKEDAPMGFSIAPEVWEKLRDLKERRERLLSELKALRRHVTEGEASVEDFKRLERRARQARADWRRLRVGRLGRRTVTPDEEIEEVPRDV
jgi:hypothetical protein